MIGVFAICLIVVLFGMLPTIGAFVSDRSRMRYLTQCVVILNICGVLPLIAALMFKTTSFNTALRFIVDPYPWLLIYGAAGMGWLVYLFVPKFIEPVRERMWAHRIAAIERRQAGIIEEWGSMEREIRS